MEFIAVDPYSIWLAMSVRLLVYLYVQRSHIFLCDTWQEYNLAQRDIFGEITATFKAALCCVLASSK